MIVNRPSRVRLGTVAALWARYTEGIDEQGRPIEVVDRLPDQLTAAAQRQHVHPLAFIANRELFGDLIDDDRFMAAYQRALASLHNKGARATLEGLVSQPCS
jgi:mannitol 2-dehydrogenase